VKEIVGGHYRVGPEVRIVGSSHIYLAEDTRTGKHLLIKSIEIDEQNLDALIRFQEEGTVLLKLRHPNIWEVYGTFIEEGMCCIVLERIEGHALREILGSERLELGRVRAITRQVAAALAYAHGQRVIHRDLNPDNIVITRDDQVKLRAMTELGVARLLGYGESLNTMTGLDMASAPYMAPEQVQGQRVDDRTDVYSLGVVMYEMVTGRPPFVGKNPVLVASQHVHAAPVPPSQLRAGLPQTWDAFILRALTKDPHVRFQTADAMERAIAGLQVPGESEKAVARTGTRSGRRCPRCGRESSGKFCGACGAQLDGT